MKSLTAKEVCNKVDLSLFDFNSTREIKSLDIYLGQERAVEAIDFGSGIKQEGFNLFVTGSAGTRRHEIVENLIQNKANEENSARDWCYIYNFLNPYKPVAVDFPTGEGSTFKERIEEFFKALQKELPLVYEGKEYGTRRRAIADILQRNIDDEYDKLEKKVNKHNFSLIRNDEDIMFAPRDENGKEYTPEEFSNVSGDKKSEMEKIIQKLYKELQKVVEKVTVLKEKAQKDQKDLKEEIFDVLTKKVFDELTKEFKENQKVVKYLKELKEHGKKNIDDFLEKEDTLVNKIYDYEPDFSPYKVNLFISNEKNGGAPVVYEDFPTYQNLLGRVEHQARMGVLFTDFTMIKPGSIHKANGGYLILDARRVLMEPFVWEGLKRSLRSAEVKIEPIERLMGIASTASLEPEPISLEVKVVLVGEPIIYYLLGEYDSDFGNLFKVQADFDYDIKRTDENQKLFVNILANSIKKNSLLPLNKKAVGRAIELSSRFAEDNSKLSLEIERINDILKEADYIARNEHRRLITDVDVKQAYESFLRRSSRVKDKVYEYINDNIYNIDTDGEKIAQINGLSVMEMGKISFGRPSRISAIVRPGKGEIVDIEKEVELGGALHSKGVLILSSFFGERYGKKLPLSLKASLVFEQSYGEVDGDSASCAELCVLISALSEIPIKQNLAITGSISQHGDVQAIGGVNEKIEGFFDICSARGLTGNQGVIIPQSNVKNLMLKDEVVEAVEKEKFFIYPVSFVDEALDILTGIEAGVADAKGNYPIGSINQKVMKTLEKFSKRMKG